MGGKWNIQAQLVQKSKGGEDGGRWVHNSSRDADRQTTQLSQGKIGYLLFLFFYSDFMSVSMC